MKLVALIALDLAFLRFQPRALGCRAHGRPSVCVFFFAALRLCVKTSPSLPLPTERTRASSSDSKPQNYPQPDSQGLFGDPPVRRVCLLYHRCGIVPARLQRIASVASNRIGCVFPPSARSPPPDPSRTLIPTTRRARSIASQRRFTVAYLMAIVLVVAADLAAFHRVSGRGLRASPRSADRRRLPMISLLILTIPRVRRGPFWIGLQAAGWITTCVFGYLAWAEVNRFLWPLLLTQQVLPRFEDEVNKLGDLPASAIFFTYIALVYTTPQILLSLLGGWIAARWSRRQARTAADESPTNTA